MNHKQISKGNKDQEGRRPCNGPIPMSYAQLLPILVNVRAIVPKQIEPAKFPYHRKHDPHATCGYHAGYVGHSTEACHILRNKVQELIDRNLLCFIPMTAKIPMAYTQFLPYLVQQGLIMSKGIPPVVYPYGPKYNPKGKKLLQGSHWGKLPQDNGKSILPKTVDLGNTVSRRWGFTKVVPTQEYRLVRPIGSSYVGLQSMAYVGSCIDFTMTLDIGVTRGYLGL
ncbi:hypothetical protein KIW84_055410 [Lathyrus oleraceus]|uniref:Uncharacterized protein n=1 Tax=Pisum sativum TaxID=3888 RepID=A0A9D4WY21_PEA|nr:hypothetical protein KIW84_055410 [Pisum sativum]